MLVRIAGLGPGDPGLLTIGSLDALRAIGRAVVLMAPPDLTAYLERNGIGIVRGMVDDPSLFVRGGGDEIASFVQRLDTASGGGTLGLGVLGNPLSDFPGLPPLLRALEARGVTTEIVPGVPRATLAASISERSSRRFIAARAAFASPAMIGSATARCIGTIWGWI